MIQSADRRSKDYNEETLKVVNEYIATISNNAIREIMNAFREAEGKEYTNIEDDAIHELMNIFREIREENTINE